MAVDALYYNYYNNKVRYTPETPQIPIWKKEYEVITDEVRSSNYSPDSDYYKANVKLEEIYYAASVANRAKYKTESEVSGALWEKYYGIASVYSQYSDEEKRAMYENEWDMTLFGCLTGNANLRDPRLNGKVSDQSEAEKSSYNRKMVSQQVTNILKNHGMDTSLFSDSTLTFIIDPFYFKLKVSGADAVLTKQIEDILNTGDNAKELFFYILNCSSTSIAETVRKKFELMKEFQNITGLDLREFQQTKDGFLDDSGKNALDIYKESLKNSPGMYKGLAYEYFESRLKKMSFSNFHGIPDMDLSIAYKNEYLYDISDPGIQISRFNEKI